jgi:hypothetical protein
MPFAFGFSLWCADHVQSTQINRHAALYITKLPKAEYDAEEWQAAMEALLLRISPA